MAEFSEMTPAERDAYCAEQAQKFRERRALRSQAEDAFGADEALPYSDARREEPTHARAEPFLVAPAPVQPPPFVPAYTKGLLALTGAELLKREFPAREFLMSPWLPSKGLAMIFAERGIGKTWVGLNIGHATAGGGSFLRWRAPCPKRVVYIDGEMPAAMIKDRYAAIVAGADFDAPEDNFRLVAADLQQDGLPDLADPGAQRFYDAEIADADLIIVDNLSTVCRALRENEADSWGPVQAWALRQRAAGKSVLLIHHAGKGGGQRGTSRKEDVLDSVISLKRPVDYDASEGARFEVHFTKSRGFFGDDAVPFEARLIDDRWETGEIVVDDSAETIRTLKEGGASVREIAERLGMSKSSVDRKLKGGRE
jgi:DNA-binding transcriptional ArsR family regulator